jgi:hypothetical protein
LSSPRGRAEDLRRFIVVYGPGPHGESSSHSGSSHEYSLTT